MLKKSRDHWYTIRVTEAELRKLRAIGPQKIRELLGFEEAIAHG